MRSVAATLGLVCATFVVTACSHDTMMTPSQTSYSGSWTALQPHSASQVGTGVTLTISGTTISAATVVTENYFGFAPQPGCLLAFTATGPTTITGSTFVLPLSAASVSITGISALPLATAEAVSAATLQGEFTTSSTLSGQLSYTINSATCGGATYAGTIPTPGFGNQIRAFIATR